MKKGITILGTLMMAVVVTSYSVSGTYAKYVSEIDLADEARVAKWKIDLTEGTEEKLNLFQDSYDYVYVDADGEKTNKAVVRSLDGDDITDSNGNHTRVVAPGTKGQYTFALTGTIETNYRIKLTTDGKNTVRLTDKTVEGEDELVNYDPIKFYLSDKDDLNIDEIATGLLTFEELQEELEKLYSGENDKVYAPGTVENQSHTIYWKWDFNGNDKYDTILGNEIVDDVTSHVIELSVNITAEQTRDEATATVTPGA